MRFIAILVLLSACTSAEGAKDKSYGKTFQQCVSDNQCVDLKIGETATPINVSGKCVMGRCQPSSL